MKKIIFVFLYVACFLLLFSTEGKSQSFNQDVNDGDPGMLPPPVVDFNQKESFNLFKDNNPPLLRGNGWDDDPNGGGTGIGELPVSDNLLAMFLLLAAYAVIIAFRNRFQAVTKDYLMEFFTLKQT